MHEVIVEKPIYKRGDRLLMNHDPHLIGTVYKPLTGGAPIVHTRLKHILLEKAGFVVTVRQVLQSGFYIFEETTPGWYYPQNLVLGLADDLVQIKEESLNEILFL